jgi:hypothetical protein
MPTKELSIRLDGVLGDIHNINKFVRLGGDNNHNN